MVCRVDQPQQPNNKPSTSPVPSMDAGGDSPSQIHTHLKTPDKQTTKPPRRRATSETDLTTSSPLSHTSSATSSILVAPPRHSDPEITASFGEEEPATLPQWTEHSTPPRVGETRARALGVIDGSSSESSSTSSSLSCASSSGSSSSSAAEDDREAARQQLRLEQQREHSWWQQVVCRAQDCEQRGQWVQSAHLLERALCGVLVDKQTLSCPPLLDPVRRAYLLYRWGLVEWKLGHYAASLDHLKQARTVYEPRDDGTQILVEIYAALGQVAKSMGATTQAKRYYLKALRTLELDGLFLMEEPDSPETRAIRLVQAKVLRQLGILLLQTGKLDKAGTALSEAVSIQQALLGCWHVEYAATLLSLGEYHEALQDYASAACLYLDALDIYRHHEEQHTATSSCRVDMGTVLARIGWLYYLNKEHTEARSVYQEAYDCMSPVLGENHPNIASLHVQIGMLYSDAHQLNQALKRFKKALDIQRSVYGDHHETVAQTLCLAASIYYRQQPKRHPRMEKALQCVDHALQVRQDLLGRWHLGTGETLVQLGRVQHKMGLARQAVESISVALEIYNTHRLPLGHPLVQQARAVLKKQKRQWGNRE